MSCDCECRVTTGGHTFGLKVMPSLGDFTKSLITSSDTALKMMQSAIKQVVAHGMDHYNLVTGHYNYTCSSKTLRGRRGTQHAADSW